MSFIDNQKTVGLAFTIIGVLMIVSAILSVVGAFDKEGSAITGGIVTAIGALIAAVLYFKYGNSVRVGSLTGKVNILGNYVRIVGVTAIIIGVFAAIGSAIAGDYEAEGVNNIAGAIGSVIIVLILGLIVIWASNKILDDKKTVMDRVLWIVLTIIFVILFIVSLAGIFTAGGDSTTALIVNVLKAICEAVIYLFMLCYMFDGEVKKAMGMD